MAPERPPVHLSMNPSLKHVAYVSDEPMNDMKRLRTKSIILFCSVCSLFLRFSQFAQWLLSSNSGQR